MTCEESAELVYHKSDAVCEYALVCDCECCPLTIVHFTFDSTHSCEARCAEEVEYEEGVACYACKYACECVVNIAGTAIEDTHCTNDVFLSNKTCDGRNCCLPCTPSERLENPCDCSADSSEYGRVDFVFAEHTECTVNKSEVSSEPNENCGKEYDCAGFLDE